MGRVTTSEFHLTSNPHVYLRDDDNFSIRRVSAEDFNTLQTVFTTSRDRWVVFDATGVPWLLPREPGNPSQRIAGAHGPTPELAAAALCYVEGLDAIKLVSQAAAPHAPTIDPEILALDLAKIEADTQGVELVEALRVDLSSAQTRAREIEIERDAAVRRAEQAEQGKRDVGLALDLAKIEADAQDGEAELARLRAALGDAQGRADTLAARIVEFEQAELDRLGPDRDALPEDDIQAAAMAAHTVNRAYCRLLGDHSQPHWWDAPEWQRVSATNGARMIAENPETTPEQSHEAWREEKLANGWMYGPKKDPDRRQHPCIMPYDDLPIAQRVKDQIFSAVVRGVLADREDDIPF